ncbi:unnamed protein product, partial [Laminaria digitata]
YATALTSTHRCFAPQGKYDQAEPLYKKTQGIFDKSFGRDHPNVATIFF